MSESRDFERRKTRGEFAHAFLRAAHYDDDEIALLGDLSKVSAAQVKKLLTAKRDQTKQIEDVVKHPPPFGPLHGRKK